MTDDETINALLRAQKILDDLPVPMEGRLIWPFSHDKLSAPQQESAMTDPATGYPVATQSTDPVVAPAVALTPEEQAEVDTLYEELKPMATDSARHYVLARTPAAYQVAMTEKIDADWPLPPAADPETLAARKADENAAFRRAEPVPPVAPQPDPPAGTFRQ